MVILGTSTSLLLACASLIDLREVDYDVTEGGAGTTSSSGASSGASGSTSGSSGSTGSTGAPAPACTETGISINGGGAQCSRNVCTCRGTAAKPCGIQCNTNAPCEVTCAAGTTCSVTCSPCGANQVKCEKDASCTTGGGCPCTGPGECL